MSRQKDVKVFFKKLTKRYPDEPITLSRDRKILEHLVSAAFLENASFKHARSAFIELQNYFIDWNEIRIAKSDEISRVINSYSAEQSVAFASNGDSNFVGDRLRRLLQWIFDKTYKFELEDLRSNGIVELRTFLDSIPYCTPFMSDYVALFGMGEACVPLDESSMRVLRLLDYVVVEGEKEIVPALQGAFKESDARSFFFALHNLASELSDSATSESAMKFLVSLDSNAAKRSADPLVKSKTPVDPSEIARMYLRQQRPAKGAFPNAGQMYGDFDDESDERQDESYDSSFGDGLDDDKGGYCACASEEASLSRSRVSYAHNEDGMKVKGASSEKTTKSGRRASKKNDVAKSDNSFSSEGDSSSEVNSVVESKKSSSKKSSKSPSKKSSDSEVVEINESDAEVKKASSAKKCVKASKKSVAIETGEDSAKVASKKTVAKSATIAETEKSDDDITPTKVKTSRTKKVEDQDTKATLKSSGKIAGRGRKTSSEPPDKADNDVGKKTTKSSPKSKKG